MRSFYFAGGGTGGHIYPNIAVAEQITKFEPEARILFFCSQRSVDARVLGKSGFEFVELPMVPMSRKPMEMAELVFKFAASRKIVKSYIQKSGKSEKRVMVATGGFVSVPAVCAAKSCGIATALINIDSVAGRANRFIGRYAKEIFVQFERTRYCFKGLNVMVSGCPLREDFGRPDIEYARAALGIDGDKKVLLITGASSGSANINNVIGFLINRIDKFADSWEVIHLAGLAKSSLEQVWRFYHNVRIKHKVLGFYDNMSALLGVSDLVVGRAGAVSVAEYAASGTAAIVLPYPYHKDNHQKLNADELADAGGAVIVKDYCDAEQTGGALWPILCKLMSESETLERMKENSKKAARPKAAEMIAKKILDF